MLTSNCMRALLLDFRVVLHVLLAESRILGN